LCAKIRPLDGLRSEPRVARPGAFLVGGRRWWKTSRGGGVYPARIALAGGVNAFQDAPVPYSKIGLEDILARNPDVIIDMGEMADSRRDRGASAQWSRWGVPETPPSRGRFSWVGHCVVPGADRAAPDGGMLHPEVVR
jgi:hypothetical protein